MPVTDPKPKRPVVASSATTTPLATSRKLTSTEPQKITVASQSATLQPLATSGNKQNIAHGSDGAPKPKAVSKDSAGENKENIPKDTTKKAKKRSKAKTVTDPQTKKAQATKPVVKKKATSHPSGTPTTTGAPVSSTGGTDPPAANTRSAKRKDITPPAEGLTPSTNKPRVASRSASPEVRAPDIGKIRITKQVTANNNTVFGVYLETAPEFRLIAFAFILALAIHDTDASKQALVQAGLEAWRLSASTRSEWVYKGGDNEEKMREAVDQFLRRIRADPPNIAVSTRVGGDHGEAITRRVSWAESLEAATAQNYPPKSAALILLSYALVTDAVSKAQSIQATSSEEEKNQHRTFLCSLALTIAHELVHVFFGFLTGVAAVNTPRSRPTDGLLGELGREWEIKWTKCQIECWQPPARRHDIHQAGDLVAKTLASRGRLIPHDWTERMVRFNIAPLPAQTGASFSSNLRKPMTEVRQPPRAGDSFEGNLVNLMSEINGKPTVDLTRNKIEDIKQIAMNPAAHLIPQAH